MALKVSVINLSENVKICKVLIVSEFRYATTGYPTRFYGVLFLSTPRLVKVNRRQ